MTVTAAIVIATSETAGVPGLLALAPWRDGETLVEYVVSQLLNAGIRDIEVVIPPHGDAIIPLIARDNVEPVIDPRGRGAASAIQIGATSLPRGTTSALVIDVAEPRPAPMLRALLDAHIAAAATITRLSHGGTAGAPFVASEQALAALRNVADTAGMARVLASFADHTITSACDDPVALLRIDSEDGLVNARRVLGDRGR